MTTHNSAVIDGLLSKVAMADALAVTILEDAIGELPKSKKSIVMPVVRKATKTQPEARTANAFAVIEPGKSIRLVGFDRRYLGTNIGPSAHHYRSDVAMDVGFDRTFKVGDYAEYDSYNLSYYGEIVSITEKTVTIRDRHASKTMRRLDIASFTSRNRDFDLAAVSARNSNEMNYL